MDQPVNALAELPALAERLKRANAEEQELIVGSLRESLAGLDSPEAATVLAELERLRVLIGDARPAGDPLWADLDRISLSLRQFRADRAIAASWEHEVETRGTVRARVRGALDEARRPIDVAEALGLHPSKVVRAIGELVEEGVVTRVLRSNSDDRRARYYQLVRQTAEPQPDSSPEPSSIYRVTERLFNRVQDAVTELIRRRAAPQPAFYAELLVPGPIPVLAFHHAQEAALRAHMVTFRRSPLAVMLLPSAIGDAFEFETDEFESRWIEPADVNGILLAAKSEQRWYAAEKLGLIGWRPESLHSPAVGMEPDITYLLDQGPAGLSLVTIELKLWAARQRLQAEHMPDANLRILGAHHELLLINAHWTRTISHPKPPPPRGVRTTDEVLSTLVRALDSHR
jgi:DNA-binding MarR family transcriptional regulator